jgi:hypothetical protein
LDQSRNIFAAVIAHACVVRVNKLSELIVIKVLLDYHVVGLRPVLKPHVELGKLLLCALELATHVIHCLVCLL